MVERRIASNEKGNKETCDTCKSALEEVNSSNYNWPIVIEKLTFNVFSHYMSTKKSKIPGGNSLLPVMVGSEVLPLICIVWAARQWKEGLKNKNINSFRKWKELLRLSRDNPLLVSMRWIGKWVLRRTKDYVNNYIMEKMMAICFCMPYWQWNGI